MQEPFNPFTYGNPITDPKRFYGRARELDQVFSRLRNPEFESSSIVGEHRMGRSSLLLYISHPDVVRQRGFDPNVHLFVYAHLDIITNTSTPTRFYQYVMRRIGTTVHDPELSELLKQVGRQENIDAYDLEDVFDLVDRKGLHIVLLLDDFEHIASNENFAQEFYYGLRSLAIHHHLALVTASRTDLVELSRSDTVRSSPFFNIFGTINLQPFTDADIQAMLKGNLAGSAVSFEAGEVEQVLRLAGRQPFFLQTAFHFLFDAYRSGESPDRRMALVEERFLMAAQPHFQTYWQLSTDKEKTVLAVMALLADQQGKQEEAVGSIEELVTGAGAPMATLERRGLGLRTTQGCAPFCSSFVRWVFQEITSAPPEGQGTQDLTAFLPPALRRRAGEWLSTIQSKYNDMLGKWLSDPRTAERGLSLLELSKEAFGRRELQTATATETAGVEKAQVASAEGLPLLTAKEREQATRHLPPEGTVTILFTDLEGSTTLFQTLGDQRARELMRAHDRILRQQITSHGGYEVKHTGDGLMVVFPSARRALACTIAIQRDLEAFAQEHADTPLRVRMGLNAGEALQEEQDFFGTAVIMAARIMARAKGGEILVSELFRRLMGTTADITYLDRGEHTLSGIQEPQHLYEVDWRSRKPGE
ncbi:MAG: AAA-like domain-containing protein [Chloroflexi bacterium]|nr:AAA-like domain-containing protein [Chloroflexota bacterium]